MEIQYTQEGIANRYDKVIELNEHLKEYPKLHDSILQHELSHTDKEGFNKQDFLLDFGEHKVNHLELLKFMIKYPKSLYQLLPIYKRKGIVFYDINMLLFWFIIILVITISLVIV